MRRLISLLAVILAMTSGVAVAKENWPREIDTEFGKLTVYQPQPEKFANNLLEGRAAVSVVPRGKTDPVFGVIWFAGKVDADKDNGTAEFRDIRITNARWPESTPEKEKEFTTKMTALFAGKSMPISLERLKASLATVELEQKSVEGLKSDPPKIVVREEPAELLAAAGKATSVPAGGRASGC